MRRQEIQTKFARKFLNLSVWAYSATKVRFIEATHQFRVAVAFSTEKW